MRLYPECHEDVIRRGMSEPCNLPAVAMRFDPTFGDPYPVCRRHVRGRMVPLLDVAEAQR